MEYRVFRILSSINSITFSANYIINFLSQQIQIQTSVYLIWQYSTSLATGSRLRNRSNSFPELDNF